MLKQILSEMYIDPDLLDQLSEEQKEILFRRMREEQVRRWDRKQEELDRRSAARKTPRKIGFLLASDGQPWVWVMGEHRDDLPYEELVRRREREEAEREMLAEQQDRREAEQLAKKETRDVLSLAHMFGAVRLSSPQGTDTIDGGVGGASGKPRRDSDVPISPQSAKVVSLKPPLMPSYVRTESQAGIAESPYPGRRRDQDEEEQRKTTLIRKASIIGTSREQQSKFEKERAKEIFENIQMAKRVAKRRAEQFKKEMEEHWKQSEEKARTFELKRRRSFQKARQTVTRSPDAPEKILDHIPEEKKEELVRKLSDKSRRRATRAQPARPFVRKASFVSVGTQPKSPAHSIQWFHTTEAPKGVGLEKDGSISIWFHGMTDREQAVRVLEGKPVGSYLVRLSTKIWGYTVSVKAYTDCKHFLVDTSSGLYHFVGPKQQKFRKLTELLKYYRSNPITYAGQEVLLLPVGQEEVNLEVFTGLYHDEDQYESSYL